MNQELWEALPTCQPSSEPRKEICPWDSNGDHPMHLHGHHFQLLYKGSESDYSVSLYRQAVREYQDPSTRTESDLWRRFAAGVGHQLQQSASKPANPMTRDTLMEEKY
ncbi:hypothetical protein B0T18DRAFT_389600 [Schizothecium vesticola]|uniref:Plastocyanin-like domain-containing protein n=1 Tax=Schizothecium vesticola TaxID=314040 RepID=A0AA40K8Y2_9PEZI|nr:hypothetical protein B0T18DRAFT_389600 [Schizothecium vesticola]